MALTYQDVSRFARENGDVRALTKKRAVTLLKNGTADTVALIEKDAVRFEHDAGHIHVRSLRRLLGGVNNRTDNKAGLPPPRSNRPQNEVSQTCDHGH